jgi:hypothetical protein
MGCGLIEAPTLAKTAIWSATAAGTNFDVISMGIVKEINTFVFETCKEADVELEPHEGSGARGNF